jgi:nitrite reductase/ring-hydroxylating ferredoxin subunit
MKRRDFIKNSCTACLSASVLPLVLNSCTALLNTTGTLVKDGLTLSTEDFKIVDKGSSAYRSFLILRNESLQYPICVYRLNEKQYSALWMKCAHQGAELQASGDYLQCPAHGSEFNNKGQVTNGPASNNLRTFPVTVNDKEIFIDLRKQS